MAKLDTDTWNQLHWARARGLTIKVIADATGIPYLRLNRMFRGRMELSNDELDRLYGVAKLLKMSAAIVVEPTATGRRIKNLVLVCSKLRKAGPSVKKKKAKGKKS